MEGVLYGGGVEIGIVADVERPDSVVIEDDVVSGGIRAAPDGNGSDGKNPEEQSYLARDGSQRHGP
jgi:hypothetical protein